LQTQHSLIYLLEYIITILVFLPSVLFIVFILLLIRLAIKKKHNDKNGERGEKGSFIRYIYHLKEQNLLLPTNFVTIIILCIISIYLFFHNNVLVYNNSDDPLILYLHLFFKSFLTPTSFIAIFGPVILALNYRLYIGQVTYFSDNEGLALRRTHWRDFIDAQFDHTHELNALIIAWIAFAYQIASNPLFSILKVNSILKTHILQKLVVDTQISKQYVCNDWLNGDSDIGESLNQCVNNTSHDLLSLIIVTLALGFLVWMLRRLLLGDLSEFKIIKIYETYVKDDRRIRMYPPLASRITLYRYTLVLFSFLYLAWSEYYITSNVANGIIGKYTIINLYDAVALLNIPQDPNYIWIVLLLICLSLTVIIYGHYFAYFKYFMEDKVGKYDKYKMNSNAS
jgi:hypothetical protein